MNNNFEGASSNNSSMTQKFGKINAGFLIAYFFVFICLCLFADNFRVLAQTNLSVREIMAEPSIAGMRPESEKLSPDGKFVVYLWNAEGKEPKDLYLASTSSGETRKILSPKDLLSETTTATPENKLDYGLIVRDEFVKTRQNEIGNLDWSKDSKKILFSQNGDLFVLNATENAAKPRRLTKTQAAEFAAQWLDNQRILFSQNGNFFVVDTEKFSLVQISKEANPQAFVSVSGATPTENSDLIAYVISDSSKQRTLFVPNYLDTFVAAPTTRRGFSEQKVLVVKADGDSEKPIEINLPKAEGASYLRGLDWLADNRSLLIDRIDKDTKRRQIFLASIAGNKAEVFLVDEETDAKWIGSLSRIIEANPKNANEFLFASERDGFNHLYLATLDESKFKDGKANAKIKQLTKGNFEVDWAKWIADGKQLVFSSTENNTATRDFYVFDFETMEKYPAFKNVALISQKGKVTVTPTPQNGMKDNPQIDKENSQPVLLYEFSQWNSPTELFVYPAICPRCGRVFQPLRLTKTTPESFRQIKWSEPEFTSFKAKDGKEIPAKIYLPVNFDKSKKYPMVVFVHGAGYLQNVQNGWNHYYREFMFNEILTDKGYVVLDIDYRGSAGYGRDFRTDVYDFLGGLDFEDHLDAIDFAVKNYSVDAKKIGVYGGSYGGFMAEMLAFRAPEKIACAAALRPVADWKNYFASSPVYTAERLGFPDKNPEAYKRSSPISYADKLQKPLLILHGIVDNNVPVQDSMQLTEKLIRLGKTDYFEEMFYPAESHDFERSTSWIDEYTRILNFFEKHLK